MAKKKLTRLGRYKICGELGRGAMGIVYEAEDPALDRTVALKTMILSDDAEGRKEFHQRFFLEAKAAGKLNHPSIITIYDFGEEGDLAYTAMELLKGIELRAKMLQGGITTVEAVDIAQQVAGSPVDHRSDIFSLDRALRDADPGFPLRGRGHAASPAQRRQHRARAALQGESRSAAHARLRDREGAQEGPRRALPGRV